MYQFPNCCKFFVVLILTSTIGMNAFSQNRNNPYSVYGIGDIDNNSYNRTSGMGGAGLALNSSVFLVDNNPASLAGLPRSFYMANLSLAGKMSTYTGDPIDRTNSNNRDFWVKRFELAVKVNGFWASSIGFGQYSNVNYKFSGNQFVEGTTTSYKTIFQGDGGLNDYHWQNAFSLGKHFSVGVKSSVIAGPLNQTETLNDEALQSTITTAQQDYISGLHFQTGALYATKLNKKWDFSIGARYAPKTRLNEQRTLNVTQNTTVIVQDKLLQTGSFYLPESIAGGVALQYDKKTTFVADYSYENWSSLHVNGTGWQLINSSRLSAGAEFLGGKDQFGKKIQKRLLQIGAFLDNSYLQVRNQPIREYGITGGMGGILSNSLLYSISLQAGIRGTKAVQLIKESYIGLTFNISYRDLLLSKGRKYD